MVLGVLTTKNKSTTQAVENPALVVLMAVERCHGTRPQYLEVFIIIHLFLDFIHQIDIGVKLNNAGPYT